MSIIRTFLPVLLSAISLPAAGQAVFPYSIHLDPVTVPGLPGLQSYAAGHHGGLWLIIGGRTEGLHARQPFASFPASANNTGMFVVDVDGQQVWTATVDSLPTGLKEQLQSTNMSFYQDADTLYLIGGYAWSATAGARVTFPFLSAVDVPGLVNAIVGGQPVSPWIRQVTDTVFAVAGGQLGKIGSTFYLVGGQRFDGNYNPMNMSTFVQEYTNQIRTFTVDNSGPALTFSNYAAVTDPVHLHRRDYNLVPQIFPDGAAGYTISSGVFQVGVDLPFLYPVDIRDTGYAPVPAFNQYLSNYHSAKACLYDSVQNAMFSLFFGGMSQYYYQGTTLVQDNMVPFVRTISLLSRDAGGTLQEFKLTTDMPALEGAGAEFFLDTTLPHHPSGIIRLDALSQDTILIGHVFGGIVSPTLNPFNGNLTSTTSASALVYAVRLVKSPASVWQAVDGKNPYALTVYPNPARDEITLSFDIDKPMDAYYYLSTKSGELVRHGPAGNRAAGKNALTVKLPDLPQQHLLVTLVLDGRYFLTRTVVIR